MTNRSVVSSASSALRECIRAGVRPGLQTLRGVRPTAAYACPKTGVTCPTQRECSIWGCSFDEAFITTPTPVPGGLSNRGANREGAR